MCVHSLNCSAEIQIRPTTILKIHSCPFLEIALFVTREEIRILPTHSHKEHCAGKSDCFLGKNVYLLLTLQSVSSSVISGTFLVPDNWKIVSNSLTYKLLYVWHRSLSVNLYLSYIGIKYCIFLFKTISASASFFIGACS
jgi:hypothetical protein